MILILILILIPRPRLRKGGEETMPRLDGVSPYPSGGGEFGARGESGGDGGLAGAGDGVREVPAFGEVQTDGGFWDGRHPRAADVCGGSAGSGRRRAGRAVCGSGRAIVDAHHQGDGLHPGDGLHRQHFEVPARYCRGKLPATANPRRRK